VADAPESKPPSRAKRTPSEWVWLVGFPLFLIIGLYVGYRVTQGAVQAILDANDGDVIDSRIDPAAPGYRLIVEPTDTGAIAMVDGGELIGAALVLPVGNGGGGTWIVIPPDAVDSAGDTLASVYARSVDDFWAVLADLSGVKATTAEVLDAGALAELVGPVAPITVSIADALVDGEVVIFPAGPNQVPADQMATLIGWLNTGESIGNRLTRHEAAITAWLDQVAAGGAEGLVGGDPATGIPPLIESLAAGAVTVDPVPITGTVTSSAGVSGFAVDQAATRSLVRNLAPFAQPADTVVVPRVLVVNGATNDLVVTTDIARMVAASGAQVTAIGNADNFLEEETVILYADDVWAESAASFASVLGVGRVEPDPSPNPAFDVVVVIGRDALDSA